MQWVCTYMSDKRSPDCRDLWWSPTSFGCAKRRSHPHALISSPLPGYGVGDKRGKPLQDNEASTKIEHRAGTQPGSEDQTVIMVIPSSQTSYHLALVRAAARAYIRAAGHAWVASVATLSVAII